MITSTRFGIRSVHVYCDEQPPASQFDVLHHHQSPQPVTGAKCVPFWTNVIDLTQAPEQMLSQMERETRRLIQRAEENAEFVHQFYKNPDEAILSSFAELQARFSLLKGMDQDQDDVWQIAKEGLLNISFVRRKDGSPIVWRSYYRCNRRTRALRWGTPRLEAADAKERQYIGKASRYGLWRDMLSSRELGCDVFDLGGWYAGSEDRQLIAINHFKKGFGGQVIQEFNCTRPISWKGKTALLVRELLVKLPSRRSAEPAQKPS